MNESLSRLVNLRVSISKIQYEVEELMPDAIAEALEVSSSQPKSRIVFQNDDGKIILCFRKYSPSTESDAILSRLDEDIKAATSKLAQKYAVELEEINSKIQQLQEAIAQLENKREELLSDRHVSRLKKEYKVQQEKSAYSTPILSVFLK